MNEIHFPCRRCPGRRHNMTIIESPPKSPSGLSPNQGAAILVFITALWGSSFVVIKQIIPDVPAAQINFARFAIAAISLLPFLRIDRRMWRFAIELGIWLFAGFATQTIGLKYTTVNRSAFITAMNVIFVPMLGAIFGKRIRPIVWAAAVTALAGCGVLCGAGGKPNIGDLWSLGTAITWATYIFRLESIAPQFPALPLAMAQFVPVTTLCGVWAATGPGHVSAYHWPALIYLGLGATTMTTWLQAAAQRVVPAPQAAVIFTLEPVFAVALGFLLLGETPTLRGIVGAALIIAAAIACQLPKRGRSDIAL
jgi:drug/metabolite transporter (DMT)-like permease